MPTRIVNGEKISILNAPYQCALHYQKSFICGCVIISKRWVLTAQHCKIGKPGSYTVRAGSTQQRRGGEVRQVQKIVSHGGYSERTMKNDLVMMKLKQPLKFRKGVQPVKLPSPKTKRFPRCYWATGWGLTSANAQNVQRYLRRARVCMVGRSRCRQMYRKAGIKIYKVMICAKGKNRDTCSGDSGGPLVHNGVLYGITSFGIGCANANYPGVYVNIKRKVKWIQKVERNVARILLHPSFNLRILDNDIALLMVDKAFKLDSNIQLVKLPIPRLNVVPMTLLVAGWGTVHENSTSTEKQLRGTLVNLIDERRCKYLYSRIGRPVTENMVCIGAPGRDHCYGDSGAPLVHRSTTYGIVFFAHGCGDPHFPGVYTKVANYVSWILSVLKY
ncbi:hypothetical protein KR067_004862, partial [Drosophila pandora]